MLAAPVFAFLTGMKSVGVRSNRCIACNLYFDRIQLGARRRISVHELPHSPHCGLRSPLASLGLALKNYRRRRIQILEPVLRSSAQNIPKLWHSGANLDG